MFHYRETFPTREVPSQRIAQRLFINHTLLITPPHVLICRLPKNWTFIRRAIAHALERLFFFAVKRLLRLHTCTDVRYLFENEEMIEQQQHLLLTYLFINNSFSFLSPYLLTCCPFFLSLSVSPNTINQSHTTTTTTTTSASSSFLYYELVCRAAELLRNGEIPFLTSQHR